MKCSSCKFYSQQHCSYFKQSIKVKKSYWAYEDKLQSAINKAIKR